MAPVNCGFTSTLTLLRTDTDTSIPAFIKTVNPISDSFISISTTDTSLYGKYNFRIDAVADNDNT